MDRLSYATVQGERREYPRLNIGYIDRDYYAEIHETDTDNDVFYVDGLLSSCLEAIKDENEPADRFRYLFTRDGQWIAVWNDTYRLMIDPVSL